MSYLVFARKWRPQVFEEVVGQEHVTTTLKNAILQNRVAHAYLFSGPRGVGKTTTARIFAKALNCSSSELPTPVPCNKCETCIEITEGRSLDVIEIDGASNRGIDEIRQLRENVKFAPSKGKYKVYIIDEVHQITADGFNALLKTLEEPPPYVKFIFATTHRHKVIPTILSRCQRFDFKRIPVSRLVDKLKSIVKNEKVDIDEEALFVIARAADGSVRDAESTLDQLVSFSRQRISAEDVISLLGSIEQEAFFQITRLIIDKDTAGALCLIDKFVNEGKDPLLFVNGLLEHFRNLAVAKVQASAAALIDLPKHVLDEIFKQSRELDLMDILYFFNALTNVQDSMRRSGFARIQLEMAMIKLTKEELLKDVSRSRPAVQPQNTPARGVFQNPTAPAAALPKNTTTDFNTGPDLKYAAGAPEAENISTATEENPLTDSNISIAAQERPSADNNAETLTEGNTISISEIRSAWSGVLGRIKSEKISAALFLFEGVPDNVQGAALTVNFPQQFVFYKEALERIENKAIIEKHLKGVLGRDIRIKFAIRDIQPAEPDKGPPEAAERRIEKKPAEPAQKAGKPAEKDNTPSAHAEPIIKSALDIFRGRIVRRQ